MEKYVNRRRRYFVRKKFQLRYIGLLLVVVFFSALVSGYRIYYNSWVLLGDKLASVYPQGRLLHIFKTVNIKLGINVIFVAFICTGIGVFASHKIAGPITRMIGFLHQASS